MFCLPIYRDVFTALSNGAVCVALRDILLEHVRKSCTNVDAVVGLDARGFLFAFLLAAELGKPFVPIRKKGKLPGKCLSYEYQLEYGSDTFEMQANSIKAGQRVVIVDDLLATGGTLNAACGLIQMAGGIIEEIIVLIELKSLNGRKNVSVDNVFSFIQYD